MTGGVVLPCPGSNFISFFLKENWIGFCSVRHYNRHVIIIALGDVDVQLLDFC